MSDTLERLQREIAELKSLAPRWLEQQERQHSLGHMLAGSSKLCAGQKLRSSRRRLAHSLPAEKSKQFQRVRGEPPKPSSRQWMK